MHIIGYDKGSRQQDLLMHQPELNGTLGFSLWFIFTTLCQGLGFPTHR